MQDSQCQPNKIPNSIEDDFDIEAFNSRFIKLKLQNAKRRRRRKIMLMLMAISAALFICVSLFAIRLYNYNDKIRRNILANEAARAEEAEEAEAGYQTSD